MNNKQLLSPCGIADKIKEIAEAQDIVLSRMYVALNMGRNVLPSMRGGHYPRVDTLDKIAKFLGCSIESLIYND